MVKYIRGLWRPFALLFTLSALLLSACGTLIPTEEPVTITFGFPRTDQVYYQSLLPAFNQKYPNITIDLKPYQDGPSGATDVVILPWTLVADNSQLENLLPLDSFILQEKDFRIDDFYPGILDVFKNNGEQVAIPSGIDPWVMFYNKDLFDRYNVPYPQSGWTWGDFLALAQAIRHPEDQTYGYANMIGYTDSIFFLYQHGGGLGDANGNPLLNSEKNVEALEWYVGLFHDYQVAPTFKEAQTDFGYANEATLIGLVGGKIGMFASPLSSRGGQLDTRAEWNFNWGAVMLPRDEMAFSAAFYEGIAITKQSQYPDASWKWVSYISSQPHNRLVPARVSLANSPEYAQLVGDPVAQVGRDAIGNVMLISNQNLGQYLGFIDIYFNTVNALVNNDRIVREELDKAQNTAEGLTQ